MTNLYWVSPLIAWGLAQLLKFFLSSTSGKPDFKKLYSSGGMPSAHTAMVVALSITVMVFEGASNSVFGLSLVFATIVIYDAFGVRRASGEQAKALNKLIDTLAKEAHKSRDEERLQDLIGHRPIEIVAGAVLGAVVSLLLSANSWINRVEWLADPANLTNVIIQAVFTLISLIFVWIAPIYISKNVDFKTSKTRTMKRLYRGAFATLAFIGGLLLLGQVSGVPSLEWQLWSWLWLLTFVVSTALIWRHSRKNLRT